MGSDDRVMDESDRQLAEALLGQISAAAPRPASPAPDAEKDDQADAELGFLAAMNAYRAARANGDADAMVQAERNLQRVVRSEFTGDDAK